MTTVRAHCAACGDVDLGVHDLSVYGCIDDPGGGAYTFTCPWCATFVVRSASRRVIDLLVEAGCAIRWGRVPARLDGGPVADPPFRISDVLALRALLESDHWFAELTGSLDWGEGDDR